MSIYEVLLSKKVDKFLKKTKDKQLILTIRQVIFQEIATNPYEVGIQKKRGFVGCLGG